MAFTPQNALVWCEIPVTDMDKAMAFYSTVFDYEMSLNTDGPNPIAFLPFKPDTPATAGHLYPGKPAGDGTGPTVHLAVPDSCEETAERVTKAGGTVLSPAIDIPAGRFIYALDPFGNSISLFQFQG